MERRQIGLILVLKDLLRTGVRMETFEDRLILQKAVYLAQVAGVNLGYFYRWYLRGPYCPALARDAFEAELLPSGKMAGWVLDQKSKERLKRISDTLQEGLDGRDINADRSKLARKLELFASVHFLIDRQQVPNEDSGKIVNIFKRHGKPFREQDVCEARKIIVTLKQIAAR